METFRKWGSPWAVAAPMVDASNLAFRMLARHHGAQLCYTPMIHARTFLRNPNYRRKFWELDIAPEDRPLLVQLAGHDPESLLKCAKMVAPHCDGIDLNLGCPQKIAKRGKYGAFLLEDEELVEKIVKTLVEGLEIPVTCKIRILPDMDRTIRIARMLEKCGCQLLVVHGRTKEMIREASDAPDFEAIRLVKESVSIPVIANGGIETFADIGRCMAETKCDGVMAAEGLLADPALFDDPAKVARPDPLLFPCRLAMEYIDLADKYVTPIPIARGHLVKMLYKYLWVHVDLRTAIAKSLEYEELRKLVCDLANEVKEHGPELYENCCTWYHRFRHKWGTDASPSTFSDPPGFDIAKKMLLAKASKSDEAEYDEVKEDVDDEAVEPPASCYKEEEEPDSMKEENLDAIQMLLGSSST